MSELSVNPVDEVALAHKRLAHLRRHMETAGIEVGILTNPVSIRYATAYRGYASFQSRIPSQYLLVAVDGDVVLHGAYTDQLSTIDRCETAHSLTFFDAGEDATIAEQRFCDDVQRFIADQSLGVAPTVGVERQTVGGLDALQRRNWNVVDIEPTIELARSRKLPEEMPALRYAIAVAELGMQRMHRALEPGITENELFAVLHHANIAHDGDWIDGRMLCSGPRTNPWYQEASARTIGAGELVAFDTDMIGPNGYCADISRTWVCGAEPTPDQRDLYRRARDEIEHNTELLKVGASFRELSDRAFAQPAEFVANRYACVFHGVGMTDEYPKIPYPQDWHWTGYDGEVEDGLVLSVESYVGAVGGTQGVKLEQMVQVTTGGIVPLSTYPLWA